jgi:N-acetylmuramoyl-L-alanine amidase
VQCCGGYGASTVTSSETHAIVLVPIDLPQRCSDAGLEVYVLDGWESYGASADHGALVFHWTASSASQSPSSCANYCAYNDGYPHYNVLVGRDGSVWFLAREKSESSGQISGVALDEALAGHANVDSAASRGLPDDDNWNHRLWAISAQNDGVGEPWSEQLINAMSVVCGLSLEALGLTIGHLQHHCGLTSRKIDLTPRYGCPGRAEWRARIEAAMHGGTITPPEEEEMWTLTMNVPAGKMGTLGLPGDYKTADVCLFTSDEVGAAVWTAAYYDGNTQGLFDKGNQWDVYLPQSHAVAGPLAPHVRQVQVQHQGGDSKRDVTVTVYGT